jgi:PAS domain S-box-containing protein
MEFGGPYRQTTAEHRLAALIESAPDAIFEFDGLGRIILVNRMAEELFGYSREEFVGQSVEMLVPEHLRSAHIAHRSRYAQQPITRPMGARLQLEARRKDGSRFPVEISLSPLESESGLRVTAIIRDVTDRRNLEQQLKDAQENYIRELELRSQESERANKLKSEFLSNMSHELRSPLHTIIGFSELLEEQSGGPLTDHQKRYLSHIQHDSHHLLNLINDLLDLNKIEAGHIKLNREPIPVDSMLEEAVAAIRPRAEAKSIEIRIETSIDAIVFADQLRIRQILHNLLSNAVKFTPQGGSIELIATLRDAFAEISINDSGIGIPPEQQESVFDKFFQVQAATRGGQESGTGLGLAITKHLVEHHGGTISLKSEPGNGSQFTFTIPLHQRLTET